MTQKIAVVDDDEQVVEFLQAVLTRAGYDVWATRFPEVAMRRLRHDPPDLVLLDVSMPIVDGFELAVRLKSDPVTRRVPLLFLSGTDPADGAHVARWVGAESFLGKPPDVIHLLHRVAAALSKRERATA